MSRTCIGSWHIRPTPSECEGKPGLTKTWAGPMSTEIYGRGLSDLCNKTKDNLMRLSLHMQKTDPCIEYGIKHWHPSSRPSSGKDFFLIQSFLFSFSLLFSFFIFYCFFVCVPKEKILQCGI